jgi:uncharacterized protein YbbC (DUF1343 family)|tara:strand:+ start:24070 stop:25695 length:1626 start_codon:yes stop_codon:yes gene_type:complete
MAAMLPPTLMVYVAVGTAFVSTALRRRIRRRFSKTPPQRVKVGLEVAMNDKWKVLRGVRRQKVGILTNHTGCNPVSGTHLVDILHEARDVNVIAVFAPEHGFRGAQQAGKSDGTTFADPKTGIHVFDIYKKSGLSLSNIIQASDVDVIVVDLQDVGTRCYTYIWSMYDLFLAVAILKIETKRNVRVVVLDRPNPLGGVVTEGPVNVDDARCSFVALKSIPLRHGLTLGELALVFNRVFLRNDVDNPSRDAINLKVVKMKHWRRSMKWENTHLPWTPPSPNMPSPTTALSYVGNCLLEATNVSEGRGTCTPFEVIGTHWADAKFVQELNNKDILRVSRRKIKKHTARKSAPSSHKQTVWREANFVPSWGAHMGRMCVGAHAFVKDQNCALFKDGVKILLTLKTLYPRDFSWREGFISIGANARPSRQSSRVDRGSNRASVLVSPVKPGGSYARSRDKEERLCGNGKGFENGSSNTFGNFISNPATSPPFIDLLTGSNALRLALDSYGGDFGKTTKAVEGVFVEWEKQLGAFEKVRRGAFLYS